MDEHHLHVRLNRVNLEPGELRGVDRPAETVAVAVLVGAGERACENCGIVADRHLARTDDHVLVRSRSRVAVDPRRNHRQVGHGIGHHVVGDEHIGVRRDGIGLGEQRLPAIGHAVAIRIPVACGGSELAFKVVGEAVSVGVVDGAALRLRRRHPAAHVLQAVRRQVLVDVRILHHHERGGRSDLRRGYAERDGRPSVRHIRADSAGVAPALPRIANAIAVLVNERHHVVRSKVDAVKHHVLRDGKERLGGIPHERRNGIVALKVHPGNRRGREIRRLVDAHDDIRQGRLGRAKVPHLGRKAPVPRFNHCGINGGAEGRDLAPCVLTELGVELRHAPVIRRPVLQAVTHIDLGGEPATIGIRDRHEIGGRVNDVGEIRVLGDLERKRRVADVGLPLQDGTGGGDDVAGVRARASRPRRRFRPREAARERGEHVRSRLALVDGVFHRVDFINRDAREGSRIRGELVPVEVELVGLHEVRLGERLALRKVDGPGVDHARSRLLAIDARAHHAHEGLAGGLAILSRDVEGDGVRRERDLYVHAVKPDVHVAREARRLAHVQLAVAVQVGERHERVLALTEIPLVRLAEGELLDAADVHETRHPAHAPESPRQVIMVHMGFKFPGDQRIRHISVPIGGCGKINLDVAVNIVNPATTVNRACVPPARVILRIVAEEGDAPFSRIHCMRRVSDLLDCSIRLVGDVLNVEVRVIELHRDMVFRDVARPDVELHLAVRGKAEEPAVPLGSPTVTRYGPCCVGSARTHGPLPGFHDNRRVERLAGVVGDRGTDGRDRVARKRMVFRAVRPHEGERRRLVRRREGTHLGEVAPTVTIGVFMGVVPIAADDVHAGLPPVLHEVVVGHDLAHVVPCIVGIRALREIVHHPAVGLRTHPRGIKERETVRDAVTVVIAPGNQPFLIIREAVVVGVVVSVGIKDAEHLLPPVGDAVGVLVHLHAVVRIIVAAIRQHAAREVDLVGLPCRNPHRLAGRQGVIDHRGSRQGGWVNPVLRGGVVLPPVGQAVVVKVVHRGRAGVRRALAVPEVGATLGERTTERQKVGAAHEARALVELEPVHQISHVGCVEAAHHGLQLLKHILAVDALGHVVPVGIRAGRVREHERGHVHFRRDRDAAQQLAPVPAVGRGAIHRRQHAARVADPRDERAVRVDAARDRNDRPPAATQIHAVVVPLHVVHHLLGEAARLRGHVVGIDLAWQLLEAVVKDKLRRQVRLAVVLVPRGAVLPGGVDVLAERLDVGKRVAALEVIRDLRGRAGAIPHAHLVHPALVEGTVVRPGGLVVEHSGRDIRRIRTHEEHAGIRLVAALAEVHFGWRDGLLGQDNAVRGDEA